MPAIINGVDQWDLVGTWPEGTAPTNATTLTEVIRYMVEQQTGYVWNTTGLPTIAGVLGDVGNYPVAQRLDDLAGSLAQVGGQVALHNLSYTGAASYTAFHVTGVVAVKVIGVVRSALSNDAATTSVGTTTSAAGLIAATAGSAMQTANQIWVDNAPSKLETFPTNWTLISESILVDGDANLAAGLVTLYCWWIPVTAGAQVVAA